MTEDRDTKINAYWEDNSTGSMNDRYVATLETEMLTRHIRETDWVLDLGCGDGGGSVGYRNKCSAYFGLERAWKMIHNFKINEPTAQVARGDLRALPFSRKTGEGFDVVVTQRALINLPDEVSQRKVLCQLPHLLKSGGKLLVCEAFRDGSENINALRNHLGFESIPPRWHNVHLTRALTEETLSPHLNLTAEDDLSMYFFLTRVVNQALNGNVPLDWDRPFNKIAYEISRSGLGPRFLGYSHIALQVWQKP